MSGPRANYSRAPRTPFFGRIMVANAPCFSARTVFTAPAPRRWRFYPARGATPWTFLSSIFVHASLRLGRNMLYASVSPAVRVVDAAPSSSIT